MGTTISRHTVQEGPVNTPIHGRRLIGLDPRSPSDGIDRTPIVIPTSPDDKQSKTPDDHKVKQHQLLDPRSPAEAFIRTPVLPPISFDFSDLENALKQSPSKLLNESKIDAQTIEELVEQNSVSDTPKGRQGLEAATPFKTKPSLKTRMALSTPLASRSPNIGPKPPMVTDISATKGQRCGGLRNLEYSPLKVPAGGRGNPRHLTHQDLARGRGKGQRRPAIVQNENSPRPIDF